MYASMRPQSSLFTLIMFVLFRAKVRKIFISGSLILQAGFLVLTAFLDSFTASVVFISLTVAAQGLSAVK